MIRTIRRNRLLTTLVLLLAGLLQPAASAQGAACPRAHGAAESVRPQEPGDAAGADVEVPASAPHAAMADGHRHAPVPRPLAPPASAAPCGVAAVPAGPGVVLPAAVARHPLPGTDQVPASLALHSLFRPPRPS